MKAKQKKKPMPPDFTISARVQSWAAEKGHTKLDERLEHFILVCQAHGYEYADWDAAFMTAIRSDWAGLNRTQLNGYPRKAIDMWWQSESSILAKGKELNLLPKPGETLQNFKGRVQAAMGMQ